MRSLVARTLWRSSTSSHERRHGLSNASTVKSRGEITRSEVPANVAIDTICGAAPSLHADYDTTLGLIKERLCIRNTLSYAIRRTGDVSADTLNLRQALDNLSLHKDRPLSKAELRWGLRHSMDFGFDKRCRALIRNQLAHCQEPKDILRLAALVWQHPWLIHQFLAQILFLGKALYRSRDRVSDREVLRVIWILVARLELSGISSPALLIQLSVKFAARARNLDMMHKTLRKQKQLVSGSPRSIFHKFRATLAKLSIGNGRMGTIRNGEWDKADLFQVLLGFEREKHLPWHEKCHLETFLQRNLWQSWHAWLAALALCGAKDQLQKEWQFWRDNYSVNTPQDLQSSTKLDSATCKRVNVWFVEQIASSGDVKLSWDVLASTDTDFSVLKDRIKIVLLTGIEQAGPNLGRVRQSCLDRYGIDIAKQPADDHRAGSQPGTAQISRKEVSRVVAALLADFVDAGGSSMFLHDLPSVSSIDAGLEDSDEADLPSDDLEAAINTLETEDDDGVSEVTTDTA